MLCFHHTGLNRRAQPLSLRGETALLRRRAFKYNDTQVRWGPHHRGCQTGVRSGMGSASGKWHFQIQSSQLGYGWPWDKAGWKSTTARLGSVGRRSVTAPQHGVTWRLYWGCRHHPVLLSHGRSCWTPQHSFTNSAARVLNTYRKFELFTKSLKKKQIDHY